MKGLLPEMMGMAVFLRIKTLEKQGGPSAEDMAKVQQTADMLGEHGDVLLHGGGKKGECADLFNQTAHAIAVLAFVPGGVELFGTRFEAKQKAGRNGNDSGPERGRKRRRNRRRKARTV